MLINLVEDPSELSPNLGNVFSVKKQRVHFTCCRSIALIVCGIVIKDAALLRAASAMLFLVSARGWSMPAKAAR